MVIFTSKCTVRENFQEKRRDEKWIEDEVTDVFVFKSPHPNDIFCTVVISITKHFINTETSAKWKSCSI